MLHKIIKNRCKNNGLLGELIKRNRFYIHDWSHIYDGIYKF